MRGLPVLAAVARVFAPLIVLLALSLFVARAPGAGVGLAAGLVFGLAATLHALTFGAGAARTALPPPIMRACLALGAATAVLAPVFGAQAVRVVEGAVFVATASALVLATQACFGRASTLRDVSGP
jgi:multisubunit Na+/H+ antiporter MnhB subunit